MSRKASVSDPKFACLGDYPGAMNCEKASIYDVDTQTEEVGSIPKTCKPNHEPISNNWDCTICKPGFTKNKETGQCEVLYENILGKHCSKFGKDDYTSHGRLSGAACQARCDADSDCLAYASKNNEWCVTYSKCTFRPGTQWGASSFSTRLEHMKKSSANTVRSLEMTITRLMVDSAVQHVKQSATPTAIALRMQAKTTNGVSRTVNVRFDQGRNGEAISFSTRLDTKTFC